MARVSQVTGQVPADAPSAACRNWCSMGMFTTLASSVLAVLKRPFSCLPSPLPAHLSRALCDVTSAAGGKSCRTSPGALMELGHCWQRDAVGPTHFCTCDNGHSPSSPAPKSHEEGTKSKTLLWEAAVLISSPWDGAASGTCPPLAEPPA